MGLDWMVERRPRHNKIDGELLQKRVSEKVKELEDCFKMFCEALNTKVVTPYAREEFDRLDSTKEMLKDLEEMEGQMAELFVSPAETLGAPRIGIDPEADSWIKENWERLVTKNGNGRQLTQQEFIDSNSGQYLIEAVGDDVDGVGLISGMLTDRSSFRGKAIGRMPWLPEHIQNQAYSDMSSEELIDYGSVLEIEAAAFRKRKGGSIDEDEDWQAKVVEAAARWCKYWGAKGHSMHAWYCYLFFILGGLHGV